MKKSTYKKPDEASKQRRKTLRPTQSDTDIAVPQRKASTPTHDRTAATTESPDISCITNETGNISKTKNADKLLAEKKLLKQTVASKKAELQQTLDFEYTRYLQSVLKNKLNEAKASEIDNDLMNVQKRIEMNQQYLQKTKKMLKNVKFNKEIDLLHSLNNPNFGKVLESVDSSNCDEYLETLNEKLEQKSNQLKLINIEMPEGGAAELMRGITDTVKLFEKLQADDNSDTWDVITEATQANRTIASAIERSKDSLPEIEQLLLKRSTIKLLTKEEN